MFSTYQPISSNKKLPDTDIVANSYLGVPQSRIRVEFLLLASRPQLLVAMVPLQAEPCLPCLCPTLAMCQRLWKALVPVRMTQHLVLTHLTWLNMGTCGSEHERSLGMTESCKSVWRQVLEKQHWCYLVIMSSINST